MIRETVESSRAVKAWNKDFPVTLGGWHPSLLPRQTLEADFVDIVVRGQGETAMLEVVRHFEDGASMDDILGIGFKREGKIFFNPERPLTPLVDLPPKAYHLADFDAYARLCGRRWAMYISSLACPFNCSYCTNAGVYGRQWNGLPPEQVVEETFNLSTRYGLEMLWIVDDNFLFSFPGEGERERRQTIAFIMDVCRRFPGAEFWTNIFTPYPGSPIMQQAQENGIEVPPSLEGWADYFPRYTVLPWLKGRAHQRLQTMRDYLRIAFDRMPIAKFDSNTAARLIQRGLSYPARWRLDHDFYALPFELSINRRLKRFIPVAKPKVDAKQLEPAVGANCP